MDEEELEQPRKKITISNFFESIQSIDKVANRALKKTKSNLGIISKNKSLIEALSKSFDDIRTEIKEIKTEVKEYITIEKDLDKDKLFAQEDQEQKIRRLERLQGIEGDKVDPADAAAGTTDDGDFQKQASETVKKALQNPDIVSILTGLIGLSVAGLMGAGEEAVEDVKERKFSEKTGGVLDSLSGNLTDFDRRGGKPVGVSGAATGIIDFFTANMFDLDKRGGLFESKESYERREKINEKIKEEKKNRPKKGLMRFLPFKFGSEIGGVDGPDGIDQIPAMLTKGETVLSKDESENLKEMGVFNVDKLVSGVKNMFSSSEDKIVKNPFKVENTNTPDFALLTAISALEGGDPQARVDVAQSIYNRLNEVKKDISDGRATDAVYDYTRESFRAPTGVFPEPTISDIILKDSQYQPAFIDPNKKKGPKTAVSDEFKNVKDRKSAIVAMKSYYDKRGDKRSMKQIEDLYDQTVIDLQDQKMNKSASAFVGGRTEFESGDSFKMGDQYRGKLGVDNTFFMGYSKDEDGNKIRDYGTGTQLETGAAGSPLLKPLLESKINNLQSNVSPIIESKSDQLAQNIFTPPTTQSNNLNLLPIPINQEQSQPISGNVSVPSPIVSPQVSTTPVTSTMSTVSFINMISNKQLSVG